MARPIVQSTFEEMIQRDLTWRLREVSDFKKSLADASDAGRVALSRAGAALLYAHWEGYVSLVALCYLRFISSKNLKYSELKLSFSLNALHQEFDKLAGRNLSLIEKTRFVSSIQDSRENRLRRAHEVTVNTKSNLNFEVLREICCLLDIDVDHFSGEQHFMDTILLGRRNHIAHGANLIFDPDEFDDLVDRTFALMRLFRNLVENEVVSEGYLAR